MSVKQNKRYRSQRGNALFLILIATVLFGALSFAVSEMMRGGDPKSISKEKAALVAADILDHSRSLRQAVQGLKINGCEETQISFENSIANGYTNAAAPANKSCHVYDSAGGAMNYIKPLKEWLEPTKSSQPLFEQLYFSGNDRVSNVGDDAVSDLIIFLPWLKESVCAELNKKLSITTPTTDGWTFATGNKFTGSFGTAGQEVGAVATAFDGKMAGCVTDAAGSRFFFQVLIAR